jgi:hypothetical protein
MKKLESADIPMRVRTMQTKVMIWVLAASGLAGLANADDIPHRKPGLWEIVTRASSTAAPSMSQNVCLDRETEALLDRAGIESSQQACSKAEIHSSGNRVTVKAVCSMGASRMTSEAVTTFASDAAYRTEVHATFDPPMAGRSSSDSVQEAKWVGACPADMQPGDMIMKSGGAHPREMRTSLQKVLKPQS